jgi:hypothetical protein
MEIENKKLPTLPSQAASPLAELPSFDETIIGTADAR